MRKVLFLLVVVLLVSVGVFAGGKYLRRHNGGKLPSLSLQPAPSPTPLPLLPFTIENLAASSFEGHPLVLEKKLSETPDFESWEFSFQTVGKKMTGLANLPKSDSNATIAAARPVIILLRGYVPLEIYKTGTGTINAANFFAAHGYITLSPDFFGYGESDPEEIDNWKARFQKPVEVAELLASVKKAPHVLPNVLIDPERIGIWAHSNGGQIALTSLEILGQPLPTTLWAPVTAPYPYSVLFFGDEEADEGKAGRADIAQFEKKYNAFDFSFTKHLNLLRGPLQLHQGLRDDAIPPVWSPEFVDKIKAENVRRKNILKLQKETLAAAASESSPASTAAQVTPNTSQFLEPISINYFEYPTADHNLKGGWSEAIARDLEFFEKTLN